MPKNVTASSDSWARSQMSGLMIQWTSQYYHWEAALCRMSVSHPILNHIVYGPGSSHTPNNVTAILRWSEGLLSRHMYVWQNSLISYDPWLNCLWSSADQADPGVCTLIEIWNARLHFWNPGSGTDCSIITIVTINGQHYTVQLSCVSCVDNISSTVGILPNGSNLEISVLLYQILRSRMPIYNLCITFLAILAATICAA